jgi:hypothetical protein
MFGRHHGGARHGHGLRVPSHSHCPHHSPGAVRRAGGIDWQDTRESLAVWRL